MAWQRLKTTQKVLGSPEHSATLRRQSGCAGFPTHSLPVGTTASPVLNSAPHVSTNGAARVGDCSTELCPGTAPLPGR